MTKPSDFIMNTDYLSLAQNKTEEITVTFPQITVGVSEPISQTIDVSSTAQSGTIDRMLISVNGDDYTVGCSRNYVDPDRRNANYDIWAFRTSQNNIRVRMNGWSGMQGSWTIPAQTVKIKIASFAPPNIA